MTPKNMTPKEALKRLRQETCPATICPDFDKEECLNVIEKALEKSEIYEKAMNIIKNKLPDMCTLKVCKTADDYNEFYDNQQNGNYYITEDEFRLLKEVLK